MRHPSSGLPETWSKRAACTEPAGHRRLLLRAGAAGHRCLMAVLGQGFAGCLVAGLIPGAARALLGLNGFDRASLFGVAFGVNPVEIPQPLVSV